MFLALNLKLSLLGHVAISHLSVILHRDFFNFILLNNTNNFSRGCVKFKKYHVAEQQMPGYPVNIMPDYPKQN